MRRPREPVVDLDNLPLSGQVLLMDVIESRSVAVHQGGEYLGTLTFHPRVLNGQIVASGLDAATAPPRSLPAGTKVMATTMELSDDARDCLRERLGPGWLVLDFHDAPDTTDVVLTGAHSTRLTQYWTEQFPKAQIIVTEIDDPRFGLHVPGPVGRLLDAGAHAYLPPGPLEQVADTLCLHLSGAGRGALPAAPGAHEISA